MGLMGAESQAFTHNVQRKTFKFKHIRRSTFRAVWKGFSSLKRKLYLKFFFKLTINRKKHSTLQGI